MSPKKKNLKITTEFSNLSERFFNREILDLDIKNQTIF